MWNFAAERNLTLSAVHVPREGNHTADKKSSWKPEHGAVGTDAFNVKWDFRLAYLFPPLCMIKRCLSKIKQDQSHCFLITLVWKSRPWYPVILFLLVGQQLLLPKQWDLLRLSGTKKIHPPCLKKMSGWRMAHLWKNSQRKDFLRKVF